MEEKLKAQTVTLTRKELGGIYNTMRSSKQDPQDPETFWQLARNVQKKREGARAIEGCAID
jgi:hypothetical protein